MPEIAAAALVSEATAYRYFPDLASLLQEAMVDQLPDPAAALPAAEAGSRFGAQGLIAHRLARGLDPRPLAPHPHRHHRFHRRG